MSDFFKDKVMSELESSDEGWLTLAIEPYTYSLLDKLHEANLPSEYNLDFNDMCALYQGHHVDLKYIIELIRKKLNITSLSLHDIADLMRSNDDKCVIVERNTQIDFKNETFTGGVKVLIPQLDESTVLPHILKKINRKMIGADWEHPTLSSVGRLNEIMELIECDDNRNSRSLRKKTRAIKMRFKQIMAQDEWRIRNCDLMIKATEWLIGACRGNMHALANLTKLKCMTHSGKIIYSMEEID